MVAIGITGRVQEKEVLFVRRLKSLYAPTVRRAVRGRWVAVPVAVGFGKGVSLAAFTARVFV